MLTRCTHCGTEYVVDDSSLPPTGLSLQCGQCQGIFGVVPHVPGAEPQPQWQVRQLSGAMYAPGDLATLQRWIVERRVSRDDLLAQDGQTWQRMGNIAELAPFFAAVSGSPAPQIMPAPASAPGWEQGIEARIVSGHPNTRTPAAAQPPRHRTTKRAMPRLGPSLPNLDEDSIVKPTASLEDNARRRRTGRRSTASRTLDDAFDVFRSDAGPDTFSLLGDHPDGADMTTFTKRSRASRFMFGALLLVVGAAAAVYVLQPHWVARAIALVRRAPVADAAVQEATQGYEQLNHDSLVSLTAAVTSFGRAIRVDERYADARAGLAETELALAEAYRQAADDLQHYAESQGKKERSRRAGQVADQRQEALRCSERALQAAKEAMTLAPESVAANRALAEYYRVQGGDIAKINPLLKRARAASPEDPRTLYVAAAVAEGNPTSAIEQYKQVLAADPHFNHARYRLARLYLRQGQRGDALEQVESILKEAPDHELAQALLQQLQPTAGELAQATAPHAIAPQPQPPAPPPTANTTTAARVVTAPPPPTKTTNQTTVAQVVTAPPPPPPAATAPDSPAPAARATASGAPVQSASGAWDGAGANASPPTLHGSATPEMSSMAPSTSTSVPAQASPPPTAALPVLPANASYDVIMTQAQLLRAGHQPSIAALLYQRAIAKDGNNPAAYAGLGWCNLDENLQDAAIANFLQATLKAPRLADAHFGLAEAYRAKNARRDAIKQYREYLAIAPDGAMSSLARQMLEDLSK